MKYDTEHAPSQRIRDVDLVGRYQSLTPRLAREWLRHMVNAGAIAKVGRQFWGHWNAVEAWVQAGGPRTKAEARPMLKAVSR